MVLERARSDEENAHHADYSSVQGSLLHRNTVCHNDVSSGQDPSAPCSRDGPAGYEDFGIGCEAANQTSELKDEESAQKGPFHIQHAIDASICGQE